MVKKTEHETTPIAYPTLSVFSRNSLLVSQIGLARFHRRNETYDHDSKISENITLEV